MRSSPSGAHGRAGVGRAGAKAILLGEHAVVHGTPALVATLPDCVIATDDGPASALSVRVPVWNLDAGAAGRDDQASRALAALDMELASQGIPAKLRARRVLVDASIPARAGLGSSAALAVAVCRLIAAVAGRDDLLTGSAAARIAGASEEIFHGRPSGVDAAAAASLGAQVFTREDGSRPLDFERDLHLVVASSGARPSTEEMVRHVGELIAGDKKARSDLMKLGDLALLGSRALATGELRALGETMNEAHRLLAGIGVSTPSLDELTEECRRMGAFGAKLTGAGGGGCFIALCDEAGAYTLTRHLGDVTPWVRSFTIQGSRSGRKQGTEESDHV